MRLGEKGTEICPHAAALISLSPAGLHSSSPWFSKCSVPFSNREINILRTIPGLQFPAIDCIRIISHTHISLAENRPISLNSPDLSGPIPPPSHCTITSSPVIKNENLIVRPIARPCDKWDVSLPCPRPPLLAALHAPSSNAQAQAHRRLDVELICRTNNSDDGERLVGVSSAALPQLHVCALRAPIGSIKTKATALRLDHVALAVALIIASAGSLALAFGTSWRGGVMQG